MTFDMRHVKENEAHENNILFGFQHGYLFI